MLNWLEERMETVYKKHPGYDPNSAPLMTFDAQSAEAVAGRVARRVVGVCRFAFGRGERGNGERGER